MAKASYDYLVVGLGFAGAVLAERLAKAGKKVLAIEKRSHIGGNAFDYLDEAGILAQKYGPHIFHTNNQEVWDYLSQFTAWIPYEHRVLSNIKGRSITLPVNLNTISELFSSERAGRLEQKLLASYGAGNSISILELRKSQDQDLKDRAETIYHNIYYNYSKKQWGMAPEKLDPLVMGRVPLWVDRDNRYFKDRFQGMPKLGYSKMFEKIVDHPNVEIILNKDYKDLKNDIDFNCLIYTGPIDNFFDFKYGELPYRSIKFQFETLNLERFQEVAVVNYPGDEPFTRITEFKHFNQQPASKTTILREYPEAYKADENVACYPIPTNESSAVYQKYRSETEHLERVVFIGRLAEYKYYNMDVVVGRALDQYSNIIGN